MPEVQNGSGPSQGRVMAYFSEQEIIQYSRLELPIIQHLVEVGIISDVDAAGEEQRCYGVADLALLRRVRRLYQDLGVNLEGIEIILHQSARIEMLQHELARYQVQTDWSASRQSSSDALNRSGTEEQSS
ncbi:MAG TPA: chaperone modulator CbpM [Ktedonobacterales bacterium]|nr:chaperone modulator CbpM [Ktedonobacterales bacterium]